jgi:DNA-binding LytR/AlgR family response regulator
MEKYKYITIDDDLHSHLSVRRHFKNYNNYTCVATFYNPKEALKFLQENEIDLIFLDIEMPEMNGFQFLEALNKNVFVVILTAYQEKHSLNVHNFYDENMFFYSNKAQFLYYFPKMIARFEKLYAERETINRINQLYKNEIHIFPKKVNNKTIPLTDIRIIEIIGHNMVLKMRNKEEHIFRMSFREVKKFLPINLFFQIRRNIIINVIYVTAFNDATVCIDEHHFQISTRKQKETISNLKAIIQALKQ